MKKTERIPLKKIELDIIIKLDEALPEAKGRLLKCIDKIKKVKREFTGVGAFVSFEFDKTKTSHCKIESLKGVRVCCLWLKSEEFLHEVPVSIVFNSEGYLDYIEFEMGMQKKEYPKHYQFVNIDTNMIVDKRV